MKVGDSLRLVALHALSRLLLPRKRGSPDHSKVRGVLVYAGMGIGNLVMYTPAIRSLRHALPHARITVLTTANGAAEVLRDGTLVDDVITVASGLVPRLLQGMRLRRKRYDVLLASFQGDDFKLITLLAHIPYRVGHVTSPGWRGRADFLYNIPVAMKGDEHEVDRKLQLIRALGIAATSNHPEFVVGTKAEARANAFLESAGVGGEAPLIGVPVDVSRGQAWKRWDPRRLAAVCNALHGRHGCKFVLLGAPDSFDDLRTLRELLDFDPIVAIGRCTLKETAAILRRCQLTICADSGLMHISAAVDTPVLAIYGPTDYRRTSPVRYAPTHRVVRKDVECGPCFLMEGDATVRGCTHRKCLGLIEELEVIRVAEEMLALSGPAVTQVGITTGPTPKAAIAR